MSDLQEVTWVEYICDKCDKTAIIVLNHNTSDPLGMFKKKGMCQCEFSSGYGKQIIYKHPLAK